VKPYFESVDLAFGNLEVTLAGTPYTGYPQFSAPDALAFALKDAGLDVLVTANNHSVDRRKKGIERTITMLDSAGLMHTGTFRDTVERLNEYPLLIERNGFTLALLNYSYGTNGIAIPRPTVVNLIDTAVIRADLMKAKSLHPDGIIVFTHWGLEYQSKPSPEQVKLTDFCFKHGAQLVIGSHPHVLQPMEWRKESNQLVVYSLGNFVSGQRDRYKNGGVMVQVTLEKVKVDSASMTSIQSAGYVLEYVHRTTETKKKYYVLPVPDFEYDSTGFIKDEVSRQMLKTFIQDSRSLMKNKNLNVDEIMGRPDRKPDESGY
jgi:poly-gamma-glutamate synthesis protein (capsule biosynthesis protein)